MPDFVVSSEAVLSRRLEVMPRRTESVATLSELATGGILLETLIGRFVLNPDARRVWRAIDGRITVHEIACLVADAIGMQAREILADVVDCCTKFCELGVAEQNDRR